MKFTVNKIMSTKSIKVEVAFATKDKQRIIEIEISPQTTISEAIRISGINEAFEEYDLLAMPVGIFGKRIFEPAKYILKDGDRIEIYRPLSKTPNQKRLDRAKGK